MHLNLEHGGTNRDLYQNVFPFSESNISFTNDSLLLCQNQVLGLARKTGAGSYQDPISRFSRCHIDLPDLSAP
ncbi:MAG: hypothetical protein GY903_28985 [Fuerstiella sp.]|nr:hypothetical protein [Fuerstiella sp.]MCP4858531.1 hypothetical protein [Fuerstiella sp.]